MNVLVSPVSIVIDVATGLIVVTLLWSGLAKLKSSHLTLKAMRGLGAPAVLQQRWIARLVPILELALGLVLLLGPGLLRFVGAVASTMLFLLFTFYIARAVTRGVEVACECFGSASHAPVDRLTVARNALLVITSLIAVFAGIDGRAMILSMTPVLLSALAMALLFVSLATFTVSQHRHINRLRMIINQSADRYRRDSDDVLTGSPIPEAELVNANGITKNLAELGTGRAVLLIFAKAGCGDCADVARSLPRWKRRLGDVILPVIASSSTPEQLFAEYPEFVGNTYFGASAARKALGVRMLPTAVLLSSDGSSVATEVVEGSSAITELVDALETSASQAFRGHGA